MPRRLFAFLSCALFAAACRASTEPAPGAEAGTYVARSLGLQAFPALTDSSSSEYGEILADTVVLDGRGGARRAFAIRRVSRTTGSDTVYYTDFSTSYRRSGNQLEVGTFTLCPPNAVCVPNEVGEITAGGLSLITQRYGAGQAVSFARLP